MSDSCPLRGTTERQIAASIRLSGLAVTDRTKPGVEMRLVTSALFGCLETVQDELAGGPLLGNVKSDDELVIEVRVTRLSP